MALVAGAFDPAPTFGAAAQLSAIGSAPAAELTASARRALDGHDAARAAPLAAVAAAKAPDDAGAALLLGLALFRDGRANAAVAPFERAVTLAPSSVTARFNLGAAQYESGHFSAAEATWLAAAALDAKVAPLATLDAGLAALDAGDAPRAAKWFATAESLARAAAQTPVVERALSLAQRAA
ncbi:MAG TPA: tetratricopeptide repeat protein, partial [Polyangia bacterium]|nr:tetratricopeptide repeat protein [Polyangia bacterium]